MGQRYSTFYDPYGYPYEYDPYGYGNYDYMWGARNRGLFGNRLGYGYPYSSMPSYMNSYYDLYQQQYNPYSYYNNYYQPTAYPGSMYPQYSYYPRTYF